MRRVKYDFKLATVPGGERQVKAMPTQAQLDTKMRKVAKAHGAVVEALVRVTRTYSMYELSDGRLLKVWNTGEVQVGCTSNR